MEKRLRKSLNEESISSDPGVFGKLVQPGAVKSGNAVECQGHGTPHNKYNKSLMLYIQVYS